MGLSRYLKVHCPHVCFFLFFTVPVSFLWSAVSRVWTRAVPTVENRHDNSLLIWKSKMRHTCSSSRCIQRSTERTARKKRVIPNWKPNSLFCFFKKNNKKRLLSLLLLLKNEDLIKEKVNLCQLIHKGILKHLFMHVEPSAAKWISDNYITLVFLVFSWAAGYVKFNVSVWICLSHGCFLFSFSDSDKNSSLSLCKRYKTPECDADARSYVADPEDPFHVRPLQGSLSLSHHVDSLWRNFTSWNFRPDMETK